MVRTAAPTGGEIFSTHLPVVGRDTVRGRVLTNAAVRLMQEDERFEMPDLEAAYDHAAALLVAVPLKPDTRQEPQGKGRAA